MQSACNPRPPAHLQGALQVCGLVGEEPHHGLVAAHGHQHVQQLAHAAHGGDVCGAGVLAIGAARGGALAQQRGQRLHQALEARVEELRLLLVLGQLRSRV
jgi:hypothetical protein